MKLTKKLISSVSVFAMLISMFGSLTASAAGTEIIKLVKDEDKSTDTTIYVDAVTTIDAAVASLTFQMDFSKVPGVTDVVATKNTAVLTGLGGAGKYTSGKVMVNDTNTSGSLVSNGSVIASYEIKLSEALEADAEISASNVIMQIDSDGDMKVDLKYNLKGTNGFELAATPSLTLTAPTVAPAGPVVEALQKGGKMYGMNTQVAKVTTNGAEVSKAKVTLGNEFKYYDLPTGVSGTLDSFIAIIRYSAELGDNPAFTLSVE